MTVLFINLGIASSASSRGACMNVVRPLLYSITLPRSKDQQGQRRSFVSLPSLPTEVQSDLNAAVKLVRQYDPSGYLPGTMLPNDRAKLGYFTARAFWVETGLRSTKLLGTSAVTPQERLQWWRSQILSLYDNNGFSNNMREHPTMRLLQYYNCHQEKALSLSLLTNILDSRDIDFNVKQYSTVQDLIQHSQQSCGSLLKLVMESADVYQNPPATVAADLMGVSHGITNALRSSIPIASQTGKIIIPADLCIKYGVRSPRFLLSALGQGDEKCKEALDYAVRELSTVAREHLARARCLREDIILQKGGQDAMAVLLPGVASETFLNRLEKAHYSLTSLDLRNQNFLEKSICTTRMISAWLLKRY